MKHASKKNIYEAAAKNDLAAVKRLVEIENVQPGEFNSLKQTAAHIAAKKGNLEILKYLLKKDPGLLTEPDGWDQTVLQVAVENGSLEMVKYLVDDCKSDVTFSISSKFGDSPLHMAAETGHLDIFKYFIETKKVDVNYKNGLGQPPAFSAAVNARLNIIKYIVEECKANITMIDSLRGNILYKSAKIGDLHIPKYLLDEKKLKIDINNKDTFGETIIHRAARINRLKFIKYFVGEKHANVNIGDNAGNTPLHLAARMGNLSVVKYLVQHGANVQKENVNEETPLKSTTDEKIIKYLEGVMKKRPRRNVLEEIVPVNYGSAWTVCSRNWIERMDIESAFMLDCLDNNEHLKFADVGPRNDRFLVFVNVFLRYILGFRYPYEKPKSLLSSPHAIAVRRTDPNIVDAIHNLRD